MVKEINKNALWGSIQSTTSHKCIDDHENMMEGIEKFLKGKTVIVFSRENAEEKAQELGEEYSPQDIDEIMKDLLDPIWIEEMEQVLCHCVIGHFEQKHIKEKREREEREEER